jgi:hypothetical protein
VVVEKVGGRSTATSCFSKYPLKFLLPSKLLLELTLSGFTVSLMVAALSLAIRFHVNSQLVMDALQLLQRSLLLRCTRQ